MTRGVKRFGCIIEGCEGKHQALGYCMFHYRRLRRYGTPDVPRITRQFSEWEDEQLVALPVGRTGRVKRGYLADLALTLGRHVQACSLRRRRLLRERERHDQHLRDLPALAAAPRR